MTDDQMQKWQIMCLSDTYKKVCKWNDMPIHIHYLHLTCLPLLSWLMILYDNLYYVNIFQNTYITVYGKTHMHTSPKSFHPIMDKFHTIGKK